VTSLADIERWCEAVVAFDFCDPSLLADLVANEPVPDDLRPFVASIISGERKPNRRKAAPSKVEASKRFRIGGLVSAVLNALDDADHPDITGPMADRMGIEPSEAVGRLNRQRVEAYEAAARIADVSRETIEDLVRDYREKVRNWPDV